MKIMLTEIDIPENFNKEIHVGEITQQAFFVKIKFDENRSLFFDIAKSIEERIFPQQLNSEKGIAQLSECLNAEISFTKRGTYAIKKKNSSYSIDSIYLALGKMEGKDYLICFLHGEKQPTLFLTYLDKIFLIENKK